MKILFAFASTHGQTRKIVRYMADKVEREGHQAELHSCTSVDATIQPGDYDAVVLAGSIYHDEYQPELLAFTKAHLADLLKMPSGFVSVSLSITLADGEPQARAYVENFIAATGLRPSLVHLAEGAIRKFDYSESEARTVELVVFKGQKKIPGGDANPEYTEWGAIDDFINRFVDTAKKAAGRRLG